MPVRRHAEQPHLCSQAQPVGLLGEIQPCGITAPANVEGAVDQRCIGRAGRAIGKDYIPGNIVARTPSGTGVQLSLLGALGVSVGAGEGLEVNVLGLVVGVDPLDVAITLPGLGRIPWRDDWTDGNPTKN